MDLVAGYESLRRDVLAQQASGSPLGLTVFLRQGMAAWMEVYSFCHATAAPPPPRRSQGVPALPQDLNGEMARILTGIVLRRKEAK